MDALAGGASLSDSVTVATTDGTQQVISIDITGANDPAVITGNTSGAVTDDTGTPATGDLKTKLARRGQL